MATWQLQTPRPEPRANLAWCADPSCSPWGWQGPHALWAQGDPRRPAGLRQELLTASQGAPAGQSQALWQFGPKKPVGQAAGRAVMGCLPALPAGLAQPRPTPRLTAFTEGSPPAGWAGAGPADMVSHRLPHARTSTAAHSVARTGPGDTLRHAAQPTISLVGRGAYHSCPGLCHPRWCLGLQGSRWLTGKALLTQKDLGSPSASTSSWPARTEPQGRQELWGCH